MDLDDDELEATRKLNGVGREKTADEMFEELEWQKSDEYKNCFWFENKDLTRITFWKYNNKISVNGDITIQELQAINKKVQELGWKG